MKEKQFIVIIMIVGIMLLGTGYCLGKLEGPTVQNVFPPKYHTEDMPAIKNSPKSVTLIFADSVDCRPTYSVMFSDSTVVDSMYPEEIANSLNTGKWEYNEMLRIIEKGE